MRLVQASDMHLDSPFATLDDELGKRRRQDQIATFQRLIELVRDLQADALLLPGDVFERRSTRLGTVKWVLDLLASLTPVPVLIAPGNHDPWEAASFWKLERPDNVVVFGGAWQSHRVADAAIWGRGFLAEHEPSDPLADFPSGQRPDIVVFHGDCDKLPGDSDYAPFTRTRLAELGAIWAAVGHIHKPMPIADLGAYAGSLEPLGFDEPGVHGALVVDLDLKTRQKQWRSLPLARCRYETMTVDLAARTDQQALDELAVRIREWDPETTLLRVELVGPAAQDGWPVGRWQGELASGWLHCEVRDLRLPPVDLTDQFTVRGRFAGRIMAQMEQADEAQRQLLADALRIGLAALEGRRASDY